MEDLRLPFTERLSVRQWVLIDVVVAAGLAAGSVVEILHDHSSSRIGAGWDVLRYLAVAAAVVPLPLRRRSPVGVLAVVTLGVALLNALGNQGVAVISLALAAYSVASTSAIRTSLRMVVAAVVVSAAGGLAAPGGPDGGAVLAPLAPAAVSWMAGETSRTRRVYVDGMLQRAAEREHEREQQARRAGAEERIRIARELHDMVAHALSIIAVRSGVARQVAGTRPDEAQQALAIIDETSRQALHELRLLVGVLRDADPGPDAAERSPAPGLADLPDLVAHIAQAGVPVGVHVDGQPRSLGASVDLSAYRIVQEALTNVVRHAAPATADLTLRFQPSELVIEVVDDSRSWPDPGLPRPAGRGAGHGIVGMRERAALYGGTLVASPTTTGFRVVAHIPTGESLG